VQYVAKRFVSSVFLHVEFVKALYAGTPLIMALTLEKIQILIFNSWKLNIICKWFKMGMAISTKEWLWCKKCFYPVQNHEKLLIESIQDK